VSVPALLASTLGPSTYWYLTRATGAVALLLLTIVVALGVADVRRFGTARWPRFVIDGLHRNVALLSVVFVALHIITTLLDGFAPISLLAAFVPFTSAYRPFWLGLGAVSFDLLLALVISSVMRRRIGHRTWQAIHWLAYACWPVALLHGFGTGSDASSGWLLALSILCVAIVIASIAARVWQSAPERARARGFAIAATAGFAVFLAIWLPSGPLGSEWARRSGTPTDLLAHSERAQASAGSGSSR
jgi:methionine sulfoxide reductase heme-binding subunit